MLSQADPMLHKPIAVSLAAALKGSTPLSMALGRDLIAISLKGSFGLLRTSELCGKLFTPVLPVEKKAHLYPIGHLQFSNKNPQMLATASKDAVVCWDLETMEPKVIASELGTVVCLSFHSKDIWLAACIGLNVYGFNLESGHTICFEGHTSHVRTCRFLSDVENAPTAAMDWIISCGDDRIFKVWDTITLTCLYQSNIVSSSPFTSIAVDSTKFYCCLGSEDGTLRFYDMSSKSSLSCEPRLIKTIGYNQPILQAEKADIYPPVQVISSQPDWKLVKAAAPIVIEAKVDSSPTILTIQYLNIPDKNLLFVGRISGFYLLDADSFDSLFRFDFSQPLNYESGMNTEALSISIASQYVLSPVNNFWKIMVGNNLNGQMAILHMYIPTQKTQDFEIIDRNATLVQLLRELVSRNVKGKWIDHIIHDCLSSFEAIGIFVRKDVDIDNLPSQLPRYISAYFILEYETVALFAGMQSLSLDEDADAVHSPGSILLQDLKPKVAKVITKTARLVPAGRPGFQDKPVTFRPTVKSSGYTSSPQVNTMFTRPGAKPKVRPRRPSVSITVQSTAPIEPKTATCPWSHKSTVTCVKYHYSGTLLASSSVDRVARFYKLPLTLKSSCRDFSDNQGVNQVSWSMNAVKSYGHLLLTSSRDGAKLWSTERTDPLLQFNSPEKRPSDARNALFYYKDRFVVVPFSDSICFYSFSLEPLSSSVKPQLNYNRLKKVKSLPSETITAFSCLNVRRSALCFSATTDKSFHIWDMEHAKVVRTIENAHSRQVHDIVIGDNIILTAAVQDSVKIWDIRQPKAVMQLNGHLNRYALIKNAISPSGTYIATGSEDHHAYIFDLRTRMVVDKTKGNHGDVVMCVDFHPNGQLVTGCCDGKIRQFV